MATLVLASTSRYRRTVLEQLRVPFECAAPPVDEEALKPGLAHLPVVDRVRELARRKAESLASAYPDALIIGADQAAEIDGEMLGKPGSAEGACAQLARLAGRTHRLHTAVAVHRTSTGETVEAVDTQSLTMRALTEAQIAYYVRTDRPIDCAGSYRIEALGVALFERIDGGDATAIVGLPLVTLTGLLARLGQDPLG